MNPKDPPMVRVWDLPTRLFHWTLVTAFILAWLTSEGDAWLALHVFAGTTMLGLILFRLLWGLVGSRHARFHDFVRPPHEVIAYLQGVRHGNAPRHLGHNPAGGYGILALLGLSLLTILLGYLTLGTEEGHGPFAGWFSRNSGKILEELHEGAALLLLAMVGVHLTGVVVESLLHRENLATAMIHGFKRSEGAPPPPPVVRHLPVALLLIVGLTAGAVLYGKEVLGSHTPRFLAAAPLAMDDPWRKECSSCHLEFHPSLLPERSWHALLLGQEEHFGEDLGLNPATTQKLLTFALAHAAEQEESEAAHKILQGVPKGNTPLRITETRYWIKKHRKIDAAAWKDPRIGGALRCENCHLDARAATFEDAAVRMPLSLQH